MPVIEQSRMRLEYPAGDEQSSSTNGTIMLRARVSPPHVNNRVWFAYQIDEGQWLRIQASRESTSTDEEQYSLAVDVSPNQARLRYLAFVRRAGITVPRGADAESPDEDQGLRDLTVYVSLTHDNRVSRESLSGDESSGDSEVGLANKVANAEPRIIASLHEKPSKATARIALGEQPPKLTLNRSAVSTISESPSEVQPTPDTLNTSATPVTLPATTDQVASAGSNQSQVRDMAWTIRGLLPSEESSDPTMLAQSRVEVFFEQKAPASSVELPVLEDEPSNRPDNMNTKTEAAPIRARMSTHPDESGNFEVILPNKAELASNSLRFRVSGPFGETIADKSFDVDRIVDPILIQIPKLAPIQQPKAVPEAKTRRVKGRVIERNCKPLPSCLQILLFARKRDEGSKETIGDDSPVFVARADSSGYFFGDTPNEKYEKAIAHVAGVADGINVPLEQEGFIPTRVLLVVDLPETGITQATKNGCNCEGSIVPRTPSHSDIEEAPDTYSVDLGTGSCVQFNTPNRAIEEFGFYSVVRTKQPDIRALSGSASRVSIRVEKTDSEVLALAALKAVEKEANAIIAEAQAEADAMIAKAQTDADPIIAEGAKEAGAIIGSAEVMAESLIGSANNIGGPQGDQLKAAAQEVVAKAKATAEQRVAEAKAQAEQKVAPVKAEAEQKVAEAKAQAEQKVAAAKGAVAEAEAEARAKAAAEAEARAKAWANKPPGRAELNAINSVDWDSTPTLATFYEATTIAFGHLLHFKQVWYADGYSLGDLLYSLPLAPGQKKLISVLDWERREGTQRTEDTFGSEALDAALSHDRDLSEVVTGALTESSRGGSKSTSFGVGVGTGAAGNGSYYGFNYGALLGVSGGYGESNSDAWQDSSRDLSSNSLQTLHDHTLQSASAIRSLRSSVVQTVTQGEAVRATTEVVANHNHCHALTIQYFEVLRHLKVTHELTDVQECLFVPLPMTEFDRAKVLRWRQTLQLYLQRRELSGGFDAARRVETEWVEVDYPVNRYADEIITSISGELQLTLMIPLPPFPERPKPRPEDTLADTATAIEKATNPTTGFLGAVLAVTTMGASLVANAVTTATVDATKAATAGARALAEDLYAQPTAQERYDKFQREVMPGVAEGFVDQLELYALVNGTPVLINKADFTLVSEYQPAVPLLVSLRATLSSQPIKRGDVSQLVIKSAKGLPTGCRAIVNSATIRYRASKFEHTFVDDRRVNDDIDLPKVGVTFTSLLEISVDKLADGNGAALFTPIDDWEQRNPKIEDLRLSVELIEHLNNNLEFYHHAIWWTMDPNRRYMLLDGYYAPGANGRSVASVVENRLIGIIGNSVVMPVARGNHLSPGFPQGVKLLDYYALESPVPASRVSLPTRGVFAEAVMGSCNACERIDDSKFWRWEESPIDEPPLIEPLSTATRRSEPAGVQPTAFPTPIVSIQNAPSVPEPAGVRPVLEALGKESFPDITGLAGTQANAAAAYQQALDTAFKFGKEASTLAQQAAMINAKDKALGAIDSAENGGKIDANEAKQLRVSALKKMVGDAPTDDKASSVADRLKVIDDQEAKGSITKEKAAELREQVMRGLEAEVAPKIDEQKATTETIRKIPAGSVESVETKDSSGATTKITAQPTTVSFTEPLETECGFFGANNAIVNEDDLRKAVGNNAVAERQNWIDGAGILLKEDQSSQFGLLVSYWLSSFNMIRPTTLMALQANARGYSNYRQLLISASDAEIAAEAARVRADLLVGAPDTGSPANLNTIVEQALTSARLSSIDAKNYPWSAVFVASAIRDIAIQFGLERMSQGNHIGRDELLSATFAHRIYVLEAYSRRFGPHLKNGTYHAFQVNERSPQIGDIIVQDRQVPEDGDIKNVLHFNDIPTTLGGLYALHGDIVIDVPPGADYVVTIGGNLSNSMRRRRYPLDANRHLVVDRVQLYTQEDPNGNLPNLPSVNNAVGLHVRSTGRIFALLSLKEECRVPDKQNAGGILV